MHLLDPKIYSYKYSTRKRDGKQGTYWFVKCGLPDGTTHQSKHSDEGDAIRERMRIIREFSGGGVSAEQSRDFEVAQRRLDTCKGDARGIRLDGASKLGAGALSRIRKFSAALQSSRERRCRLNT